MVENDDAAAAALRAGARDYLVKDASRAEKTVRKVVSTIFGKLEVSSRAEAVARTRDAGLGGAAPGFGVAPRGG